MLWAMSVFVVTFFAIAGSGFFTILYSMEWGREKSLEWLSTFLLSFFQSVAVVQPIKVYAVQSNVAWLFCRLIGKRV